MRITKRERSLMVIVITGIFLGLNYFLVVPLARSWHESGGKLARQQRAVIDMKGIIARKPQWQSEYDELKQSLGQRTERFQRPSDVVKKVEQVAGASGVVVSTRREMPVEDKGLYVVLPAVFTVEANTDSLVKFLFALQTGAGFISVEQLRVNPRPENPSILRCDIQVRALSGKLEGTRS